MAFDVPQLPPPKMPPNPFADVEMSFENVLNIWEAKSSLSTAIRDQIQGLARKNRNVLQKTMDITTLTPKQVVEAMEVITNEL